MNIAKISNRQFSFALALIFLGSVILLFPYSSLQAAHKNAQKVDWIRFVDGRLVYGTDQYGNRIPDFSSVGYEQGTVPIPDIPVKATLDPVSGEKDATARIQAAIDSLAKQAVGQDGVRGALLLHAGVYHIAGMVQLNASGIVLRGEGAGEHGTMLIAEGAPHTLIRIGGEGSWQHAGEAHNALDDYVPVGASAITVYDSGDLKPGDRVIVQWSMDAAFIHTIGMDQIPPRKDGGEVRQWEPGMGLKFDRRIVKVESVPGGKRLTLDVPLTTPLTRSEGATVWRYTFPGRIDHVGVENLASDGRAFETAQQGDRDYFNSKFLGFDSVENAWMRNVKVSHYSSIVSIDQFARAVTVTDIQGEHIDTAATHAPPHAFAFDGQMSLIERCNVTGSYSHVWATQSRVAGPDVFRDCTAKGYHLDAGPHERWATGVLYENLKIQGSIRVENRSNKGTGHGWAGASTVLWNCEADDFVVESPPVAYNWAFGVKGSVERHGTGHIISPGKKVEPESLYEEQVKERNQGK